MTPAAPRAAAAPGAAPVALPARTGPARRPGPATRQTALILAPLPESARAARRRAEAALTLWGLAHHSATAELVTSELVTNAIAASHAAAPPGREPLPLTLSITARDDELCIRVWDPDPAPPPRDQTPPDDTTENGRGLILVAALSQRWGSHPAPNGGKYTWATLTAAPANPSR
jgi:anti-sigma regulatory factor (Ser/Thr protein kinase)